MAGTLLSSTTFNDTNANDQLNATLNKNSLLMRMAKTKGQQEAGSRGLMNSSIGSEASMRAMVDAASPIAQQNTQFAQNRNLNQQQADLTAKRDATQQQYNKDNMASQFGYSTKLNEQQNTFSANQSALDRAQQIKMQDDQQDFASGQSALDRAQQIKMQDLQYKNQLGLLDAQGKQELAQMQAQFGYSTQLNNQQNAFTAGQSALDRAQQTRLQDDQQGFAASQSDLDRKQQLTMQNDQQDFASSQSALDRAQQTNLANLGFTNQTKLNAQQNAATTARDKTLFGYDQQNKATDFANSLKTMSEQQKNDLARLAAQTSATKDINAQQQQYTLTNTAKQVAANTQGMYLDAINSLTSTFGDQVATIQASAMKAADKKTAINSLINSQNAMLKFYQSTYQNMSTIKDDWINVDVKTLPSGTIATVK